MSHVNDSVSTVVVRQAGEHDGWVNPSDTVQLAEAGDQSLSNWTKLAPLPLLRMALHQGEWNMPALSTSENQFHSPICRSIGTMGLQTLICPPFDIPNSLKIASPVVGRCFVFFTVLSKIFFMKTRRFSRSAIVCIVTNMILCDVSNKCLVNAL